MCFPRPYSTLYAHDGLTTYHRHRHTVLARFCSWLRSLADSAFGRRRRRDEEEGIEEVRGFIRPRAKARAGDEDWDWDWV